MVSSPSFHFPKSPAKVEGRSSARVIWKGSLYGLKSVSSHVFVTLSYHLAAIPSPDGIWLASVRDQAGTDGKSGAKI